MPLLHRLSETRLKAGGRHIYQVNLSGCVYPWLTSQVGIPRGGVPLRWVSLGEVYLSVWFMPGLTSQCGLCRVNPSGGYLSGGYPHVGVPQVGVPQGVYLSVCTSGCW